MMDNPSILRSAYSLLNALEENDLTEAAEACAQIKRLSLQFGELSIWSAAIRLHPMLCGQWNERVAREQAVAQLAMEIDGRYGRPGEMEASAGKG